MPIYEIWIPEKHISTHIVEAKDKAEALQKFYDGDTEESLLEYSVTLQKGYIEENGIMVEEQELEETNDHD